MSEYADIKIRKKSLYTFRNYLYRDIVSLFFSGNDLIITENYKEDYEDEDSEPFTKYEYRTTVQKARQRLDAQGYSVRKFEEVFNMNMVEAIDYSGFLFHLHVPYDDFEERAEKRIKKYVTFQKWKNSMKKIVDYELDHGNIMWDDVINDPGISTECDKVIFYSLTDYNSESFYALSLEIVHIALIFRLILEYCDIDEEIVLDFSYLAFWSNDSITKALEAAEYAERTIVLVEGTSDKRILEFAMRHIFPHLSDLFYFMDFEDDHGGKRDGGTSYVIKNLKTFYFSKLKARFIAIFDNDAEGYQSQCTLLSDIKDWPDNFKILLYPDISQFKKYPTIAPNGRIIGDNINRKACSVELYLPDSLITGQNGYYPVEWEARKTIKNNDGKEDAIYQGRISHKSDILNKFATLQKQIEREQQPFVLEEWTRMKMVLETIVFAFQ